jgi:outer membrane immunogenic protein
MRVKFLCGLLASIAAGAGSAVAADMPVRPPVVAPVAAPVFVPDWVGFYVGVHAGGGWGRKDFEPGEFETDSTDLFITNASPKGGVFGFQFGHNWQWGPVVGGLEIDFSGADIKESTPFFFVTPVAIGDTPAGTAVTLNRDVKIDSLASARGRLGWLIFPNLLGYGTAGIGWGHQRLTTTETTLTTFETNTTFTNEFGWVAGVGLEWKFAQNWLLRGEWLHYDFGRSTHPDASFADDNLNVRTTVDVARAAVSCRS